MSPMLVDLNTYADGKVSIFTNVPGGLIKNLWEGESGQIEPTKLRMAIHKLNTYARNMIVDVERNGYDWEWYKRTLKDLTVKLLKE